VGEPIVSARSVRVAAGAVAVARLAAAEVAARAEAAAAARGRFTLALSGGATPRHLHALLADSGAPFRARIPWRQTHVFFADERHVPPDHAESNYGAAREDLLSKVPIPSARVHRVRAEGPDAAAVAVEYERELLDVFGLVPGEVPHLDVALLGMGEDGHTASLFPGSPALDEASRLVVAPWVERLGTHRITLTLPVLCAARAAVFLVSGAEKAARVAEVLEGAGGALPAGRVRPSAGGDLVWLIDAPAAAQLRSV
jgi:6-phosphogluconolactonase